MWFQYGNNGDNGDDVNDDKLIILIQSHSGELNNKIIIAQRYRERKIMPRESQSYRLQAKFLF